MGKKKVILDTNILISALGWEGKPREIFNRIVKGKFELVTSPEQIAELSEAINYPRLGFTEEQKLRFLALVLETASLVESKEKLDIIKEDPEDNRILECAISSDADYIVTGNKHLLKLKKFRETKIITAKKFLNIYKQ